MYADTEYLQTNNTYTYITLCLDTQCLEHRWERGLAGPVTSPKSRALDHVTAFKASYSEVLETLPLQSRQEVQQRASSISLPPITMLSPSLPNSFSNFSQYPVLILAVMIRRISAAMTTKHCQIEAIKTSRFPH